MIMVALALMQSPAPVSLAEVRRLPPAAAGDAVLGDRDHAPIEQVEIEPVGGMNPPGTIRGMLVERPAISGPVCVRRRWTATFRAAPGADIATAVAEQIYSTQEIALSVGGRCPSGRYAHLNSGVGLEGGWHALAKLAKVGTASDRTPLQCSDSTSSGLCRGNAAIRHELRTLKPWTITRAADETVIWLGQPGGAVTEMRFNAHPSSGVAVKRTVPAPF